MATLLESVGFFSDIFDFFLPFLLVFAVLYAILLKSKFLTEDPNLNAAISFAIALIVALSGAGKFLMSFAPFMATLFMILFFMILMFLFFGVKLESVFESKAVVVIIVGICLIFVFYVLGNMWGGQLFEAGQGTTAISENETLSSETTTVATRNCDFNTISQGQAIACLISNPKVLGAMILLGLLAIATFFVVYVPKK